MTGGDAGERWVTVSHEALIRGWPRLRKWLDEDRAGQRLHRQIAEAAGEWQRLERDDSALLRGLRLAQARELLSQQGEAFNEMEVAFLTTSEALERAEVRRRERARRQVLIGLSLGLAVALSSAAVAVWQWQRAQREQRTTTVRGLTAQSDLLRTHALATLPGWPDLVHESALLALEAYRLQGSDDSVRAVRASADLLAPAPVAIDLRGEDIQGISPAVDRVAVASKGGAQWSVLDLTRRAVLWTIPRAGARMGAIFSPNGDSLLVVGKSGLSAWQLDSGTPAKELWTLDMPVVEDDIRAFRPRAVFAPDGKTVATFDGKTVLLLDAATGRRLQQFEHAAPVSDVAFSSDGRRLVWAGAETAAALTVATGQMARLQHSGAQIVGLAVDASGVRVATIGSRDVRVWDITTPEQPIDVINEQEISVAKFDELGSRLGLIDYDNEIAQQFSVKPAAELVHLRKGNAIFSLDARFVGFRSPNGELEIWDLATGRPAARVFHNDQATAAAFGYSLQDARLLVFGEDKSWVYDTAAGTLASRWSVGTGRLQGIDISQDRHRWALRHDRGMTVVNAQDGRIASEVSVSDVSSTALNRDGTRLLTLTARGTVRLWDVTGNSRQTWGADGVNKAALSPDGAIVVTAGPGDAIRAHDVASGKELWAQAGVNAYVEVSSDDDTERRLNVVGLAFLGDGGASWPTCRRARTGSGTHAADAR